MADRPTDWSQIAMADVYIGDEPGHFLPWETYYARACARASVTRAAADEVSLQKTLLHAIRDREDGAARLAQRLREYWFVLIRIAEGKEPDLEHAQEHARRVLTDFPFARKPGCRPRGADD